MTVLLMGFRLGAAKSLEKMEIPYIIWAEKPLKNRRKCTSSIIESFPNKAEDLSKYLSQFKKVTHVIAATESAVIPSSFIRKALKLYRNSESVIIRCTDKYKMKQYLDEKNIPMTKFLSSKNQSAESIVKHLGLPVVNKIKLSSGGRGVFFISKEDEIKKHLNRTSYFEKIVEGVEGSIESFIVDRKIVFTNITQYYVNGECSFVPAQFAEADQAKIRELNSNVINALNLKWGMTHLEYYVTKDGVLFGEVALRPPGGYIMDALEQSYSQNFWDAFIKVELIKNEVSFNAHSRYSCTMIIHPGQGVVKDIKGIEHVKKMNSTVKFRLNLKVGDVVGNREGVGQDYGHLILSNASQRELMKDVKSYFDKFKIIMRK